MICLMRVWATVYGILAIKIAKKTVKTLISDQTAFATVLYFGQVFGFRRSSEDLQMPLEVYYQKIPQYSEENTCVEVSFK